jgi:hypothetical protein
MQIGLEITKEDVKSTKEFLVGEIIIARLDTENIFHIPDYLNGRELERSGR